MTSANRELHRLAQSLVWRGSLMALVGGGALIWPEPFLVAAMVIVGVLAALFGIYEISIAVAIRDRVPSWRMVLAHGSAVLAFGLLTVEAPNLTFSLALAVIVGWFLVYAIVAFAGAAAVWSMRSVRWALITWGLVDIAVAALALAFPLGTMFALLGVGALYAVLFGIWQIALGMWLRRRLETPARESIRHEPAPVH
ncbi:MAG TPA: DUF308 domain-containing protein [Gemmatimonadaceae bacterium]|nr:DUF308 domain-containing protein [Gemmatimonadaceae bacterium]